MMHQKQINSMSILTQNHKYAILKFKDFNLIDYIQIHIKLHKVYTK